MTKEEIVEAIANNKMLPYINPDFLPGIVDFVLDNSQPSLPSNLDEAAEEWCKRNNKGIALCADKKSHYLVDGIDAFKAGAEWNAGQGETHELTVESPVIGPPMICCPVHADNGDKVIVQIRKK